MVAGAAIIGIIAGLCAVPLVRWLPRGIPERLEQPAWTLRLGHPFVLVGVGACVAVALAMAAVSTQGLLFGLVLLVVLLPAVAIDVAWRVVPDSLLLVGTVGCLLLLIVGFRDDLLTHLLVTVAAGVLALLVALTARGGVGLGDVKLIALIGLALGAALPMAFVVTALVSGVAVVPILLARGRRATLPLVPFLAVGALVASTGLGRGLLFGL